MSSSVNSFSLEIVENAVECVQAFATSFSADEIMNTAHGFQVDLVPAAVKQTKEVTIFIARLSSNESL